MRIERFFYGMVNGKIILLKTDGVNEILSDRNFHWLKKLTPDDSDKYVWLPTEQLVALPHIELVEDGDGRTWVQNETLLIPIHDYLRFTKPSTLLSKVFASVIEKVPETFEPIQIKEG